MWSHGLLALWKFCAYDWCGNDETTYLEENSFAGFIQDGGETQNWCNVLHTCSQTGSEISRRAEYTLNGNETIVNHKFNWNSNRIFSGEGAEPSGPICNVSYYPHRSCSVTLSQRLADAEALPSWTTAPNVGTTKQYWKRTALLALFKMAAKPKTDAIVLHTCSRTGSKISWRAEHTPNGNGTITNHNWNSVETTAS